MILLFLGDSTGQKSRETPVSQPTSSFYREYTDLDSLCRVYKKQQLVALCEAYLITVVRRWNKKDLAAHLSAAVKANTSMPLTVPVDDRLFSVERVTTNEQEGSVRMVLRRQ